VTHRPVIYKLTIVQQEMQNARQDLGDGPVDGFEVRWLIECVPVDGKIGSQEWSDWFFVRRPVMNDLLVQWSQYLTGHRTGSSSAAASQSHKPKSH
jgi:hypothetical protein